MYNSTVSERILKVPQYMVDNIAGRRRQLIATHFLTPTLNYLAIYTPGIARDLMKMTLGENPTLGDVWNLERRIFSRSYEVDRAENGLLIPCNLLKAIGLRPDGGRVHVRKGFLGLLAVSQQ